MLRGRVGPGRAGRDGARCRGDVDDVGRRVGEQAGEEGAQAPDAAEVVDARDELDPLGVAVDEARPRRDAGVVDEQADLRVALEDRRGDRSTASRSPTSQTSASPPISSASFRSSSSRRASSTQRQPRLASARAIAAPIPDEPPVTTLFQLAIRDRARAGRMAAFS